MFAGRLLSADLQRLMMWVEMEASEDFDARRDSIIAGVTETVDEVLHDIPHALAGVGVIYSGLNLATQHDFGLFVGIVVVLVVLSVAHQRRRR